LGPILNLWGAATARAYRESALFSEVAVGSGPRDLRVNVALRADVHEIPPLTFFSYLTLLVLPYVVTTDITVTTTVTALGGQPLRTLEVTGKERNTTTLLLTHLAPCRSAPPLQTVKAGRARVL